MDELENALTQDESEDESSSEEVLEEQQTAETPEQELVRLRAELTEKAASLDKLNRDYSSLKGQLKPQQERDAEVRDEINAIHRQMAIVTKALVSGESEDLSTEYAQVASEVGTARQNRALQRFYDDAIEEVKTAMLDDEGKALLDLDSDDEGVVKVKALWKAGQSGKGPAGQDLSVDERINKLAQAVGEIHKLARQEERRRAREAAVAAKTAKSAAKKQEREETGELDLDTGPVGAGAAKDEALSPRDRIERGLAKSRKAGKKSTIFVTK